MVENSNPQDQNYLTAIRMKMKADSPSSTNSGGSKDQQKNAFTRPVSTYDQRAAKTEMKAAGSELANSMRSIAEGFWHHKGKSLFGLLVCAGYLFGTPTPDEAHMTIDQRAAQSESMAVVLCNEHAQKQVKNPTAYQRVNKRTERVGFEWVVYQNFTAMNGFGANLDNNFLCKYDYMHKNITFFEIYEGSS